MNLANWALRTSPKFTTGVKYTFHQDFCPRSEIRKSQSSFIPNQNIVIGTLSFILYFGSNVNKETKTNDIREEIKRRINMGNACYYSLEKILSSRLLYKKLKVKTYKTIILPVVLCGCETWSLTMKEE